MQIQNFSIAQLEARANQLRIAIGNYEAQFKEQSLDANPNLAEQIEALIDEADAELSAIDAQLYQLEGHIDAPDEDDVDDSDFGRYGACDDCPERY